MNNGLHSLTFAFLYGGGLSSGISLTPPSTSSKNISSGLIRSFYTPLGAITILSPTLMEIPPPVPDTKFCSKQNKYYQTPIYFREDNIKEYSITDVYNSIMIIYFQDGLVIGS